MIEKQALEKHSRAPFACSDGPIASEVCQVIPLDCIIAAAFSQFWEDVGVE